VGGVVDNADRPVAWDVAMPMLIMSQYILLSLSTVEVQKFRSLDRTEAISNNKAVPDWDSNFRGWLSAIAIWWWCIGAAGLTISMHHSGVSAVSCGRDPCTETIIELLEIE
jgi:hypothetical protein